MPEYLRVREIRSMEYADLKRWWEVDRHVLESTAVAEATGEVHSTVREALRSDEWIERWSDSLYGASAETASSVERMTYERDIRLRRTRRTHHLVTVRRMEVDTLMREFLRPPQRAVTGETSAFLCVLSLLAGHHRAEFRRIREDALARRGLAGEPPFSPPEMVRDRFHSVEFWSESGLIDGSMTEEVHEILDLSFEDFVERVSQDIYGSSDRIPELRHPLVLQRWRDALLHLKERHSELVGMEVSCMSSLPSIDWKTVSVLPSEEVWSLLNRRRFIRSAGQRERECLMRVRSLLCAAEKRRREVSLGWIETDAEARRELAAAHPDQAGALAAALRPFCLEDGVTFDPAVLPPGSRARGDLLRELRGALEDGRWRNLAG